MTITPMTLYWILMLDNISKGIFGVALAISIATAIFCIIGVGIYISNCEQDCDSEKAFFKCGTTLTKKTVFVLCYQLFQI